MKLLYLVPEFPSQTHAFFWREIKALESQGAEVFVVSTVEPADSVCRHEFVGVGKSRTFYLFPPAWISDPMLFALQPTMWVRILRYVLSLRESSVFERIKVFALGLAAFRLYRFSIGVKATHLHVHSFANSAHIAAIFRSLGGCDYSLVLHGDLDVYGKDHCSKVGQAKFVFAVTRPLVHQLVERTGIDEAKVHLLSMGVDTSEFLPKKVLAPRASSTLRAIMIARLHVNKGHRYALRALRKMLDSNRLCELVIVGEGPARAQIEQEIKALGLDDHVRMTGSQSESEVRGLLQSSDCLLLTSIGLGEAAPVAVMEAMASGVPTICSIIGGTKDMIEDGVDGFLVEQEDVQAIVEKLILFYDNPSLVFEVGLRARLAAVEKFDSAALVKRLISIVES